MDNEEAITDSSTTTAPVFSSESGEHFQEYFDLITGAQIEIQDEIEIPTNLIIRRTEEHHHQWSPNERTIEERLPPFLQDLLEFHVPSNNNFIDQENIESNEIHFDGSEFFVPLEDAGMQSQSIAFTGQEEEVTGSFELLETSNYLINANHDQQQLVFANDQLQINNLQISSNQDNQDSADNGDADDSESQSDLDCANRMFFQENVQVDYSEDFLIKGTVQRRKRFLKGWNMIKAKIRLMNSRAGTTCNLEAILESERFKLSNPKSRPRHDSITASSDSLMDDSDPNDDDDDHRYAAVILTQKVSSRTVRDHQYNERPSREVTDEVPSSPPSNSSFVKKRSIRERSLIGYLTFLFSKIKMLKAHTGASIHLKVLYEDHIFTERNFKDADAILRKERKDRYSVPAVPVIIDESETLTTDRNKPFKLIVEENLENANGDSSSSGNKFRIRCVINKDTEDFKDLVSFPSSIKNATQDESISSSLQPIPIPSPRRLIDNVEIPDHWYGVMDSTISFDKDYENVASSTETTTISGPPSQSASMIMVNSPQEEQNIELPSGESVESASHKISTRDTGTSTEPLCSICSSSYPPSTSRSLISSENLWIRCFDPMCQILVHPSCIGFRVSNTISLKMLPPYFCTDHRSD